MMKARCVVRRCGKPIPRKRRGRPQLYCADCAKEIQALQIARWKKEHREAR